MRSPSHLYTQALNKYMVYSLIAILQTHIVVVVAGLPTVCLGGKKHRDAFTRLCAVYSHYDKSSLFF